MLSEPESACVLLFPPFPKSRAEPLLDFLLRGALARGRRGRQRWTRVLEDGHRGPALAMPKQL